MWPKAVLLLAAVPSAAMCQATPQNSGPPPIPRQQESIVVTGTFVPAPLSENDRSVESLDARENPLVFSSVIDYLHVDSSIDLQQRAPDGVQADLNILGSTFAETLVLLNGLHMNDAQTAHPNMDIPIPLEAMSRIEVLHGGGSTFYGSDARGGAGNFITAPARAKECESEPEEETRTLIRSTTSALSGSQLVRDGRRRRDFLDGIYSRPRFPQHGSIFGKTSSNLARPNRDHVRGQRSFLWRRSILRRLPLVGGHQELVRIGATGTRRPHNRGLRLSPAPPRGTVRPYLELANWSNTGYEEIPGVLMPSRSIVAGMELVLTHKSH